MGDFGHVDSAFVKLVNNAVTYTEAGSAVAIANAATTLTDVDSTNLSSATVTLTNQQTGDRLLVNGSSAASGTLSSGIAWTRTDTAISLSGSYTKAQYATALSQIQFENTGTTPGGTQRVVNTVVSDGTNSSNTAVTTISVNSVANPVADLFSGNEDTAISGNVLTNDIDLGDTPITSVAVATGPTHGTLTSFNTATGAFVYTPTANYNGTDSFTYTVTDANGDTATQTVSLTINSVNDAPVITSNGAGATAAISVAENQSAVTTVTSTDVDASATATYTISGGADARSSRSTRRPVS